jgi:hypothetical protein
VVTRGEYETISAADPAAMEHRLSLPGERPRPAKASREPDEEHEGAEISLAPPVEVAEAARDPRTVLPRPEMEPEDPLYNGRYDDGLIGDFVDPRSPDAWKKAPLLYGIVEFLFFPSTLLRLVMFGLLLSAVGVLANMAIRAILEGGAPMFIMWAGIPLAFTWLLSFAAAFHTVVVATANGQNAIEEWPDWQIFEWLAPAMYTIVASALALVPGGLVAGLMTLATHSDPMMAAFAIAAPPLMSWLLLFPFVLHSMLAEDSVTAVASPIVINSLKTAADAWVIFYAYSMGIAFLLAGGLSLMAVSQFLITAVGAMATTAVVLLYARLLGRLMWYTSQKDGSSIGRRPAANS